MGAFRVLFGLGPMLSRYRDYLIGLTMPVLDRFPDCSRRREQTDRGLLY